MIIELLVGGAAWLGAEYLRSNNSEKQRLDRLFRKCGLCYKDDTPKLIRSTKKPDYTEYIYRIPEGISARDFEKKREVIETGINSSAEPLRLADVKNMRLSGDLKTQYKALKREKGRRREVVITYDKVLKVRIYRESLTEHLPYANDCKDWTVKVGITRDSTLRHDYEKVPHMVIAGTTRYGKSVFLKNVITTLIENKPADVYFTLIDLKGGLTFARYADAPQVIDIASDTTEASEALELIDAQLNEMMVHLKAGKHENAQEAGIKARHFIIVDEGAELAPGIEADRDIRRVKARCEAVLSRIARIGGALGYRLIYATQTPYSEVLNHNIKQNCDAKLCFRLQTDRASEVVLGEGITDAASLPYVRGRAVYLTDRKYIVQTPLIENDYIEGVVRNVKASKNGG